MVICHDGEARPPRESVFRDPSPDGFCHTSEFCVRAALDLVMSLEFQCDVVRPALCAFDKAVVEGGHGLWVNIPEIQRCLFAPVGTRRSRAIPYAKYPTPTMPPSRFGAVDPSFWSSVGR